MEAPSHEKWVGGCWLQAQAKLHRLQPGQGQRKIGTRESRANGKYRSPECWQLLTRWPRTHASQANFSPLINMVTEENLYNVSQESNAAFRRGLRSLVQQGR